MNDKFTKFIVEICGNILNNNIIFDGKKEKEVEKLKKVIRKIIYHHKSLKDRKKVIQKGGFVPQLIGLVGPAILSFLLQKATEK